MSSKAAGQKTLRLISLETWARERYPEKEWPTKQFKLALHDYCLITWGVSEGMAKNMSNVVQLRLTRRAPAAIERAREEEEFMKTPILDILAGDRAAHPGDYAVPKTDFPIIDE